MAIDRTRRLSLQVRVSDVVHQRWIESGRVHGTRDAAGEDHRGGRGIIHEDDALRQLPLNQDGGMGGDAGGAADEIVEAVMKEERVGGVVDKALPNFLKADRAVITGWHVRHVRPLPPNVSWSKRRCPSLTSAAEVSIGIHAEGTSAANVARAHVRATAGTSALRDRCMVTLLDSRNLGEGAGEVAGMGQGIGRGLLGVGDDTRMAMAGSWSAGRSKTLCSISTRMS